MITKKLWVDFDEIFWVGMCWDKEDKEWLKMIFVMWIPQIGLDQVSSFCVIMLINFANEDKTSFDGGNMASSLTVELVDIVDKFKNCC